MINNIAKAYANIENFVTNFLYVGIVFFVFLAAVMRWVGFPLSWSVEFAQLLFVWAIFLGANRTLREKKHITVDIFTKFMPEKLRKGVEIFTKVVILGFLVFLMIYGFQLSAENSVRQINNLPLSYSFITLAVPIGSLLMFITTISQIIEDLGNFKKPNEQKS